MSQFNHLRQIAYSLMHLIISGYFVCPCDYYALVNCTETKRDYRAFNRNLIN